VSPINQWLKKLRSKDVICQLFCLLQHSKTSIPTIGQHRAIPKHIAELDFSIFEQEVPLFTREE